MPLRLEVEWQAFPKEVLMPKAIRQSVTIKATPQAVYEALMDSRKHARFTGGTASISRKVGGKFSVFDGYAEGINLKLVSGKKIVQTWRANDWPKNQYSKATFALTKVKSGTRLTFTQTGVPDQQYTAVKQGWIDFYWTPLKQMSERSSR